MIHATYHFYSNVLGRMTGFHAILPRPQSLFQQADLAAAPKRKKSLWFLHGVGDCGEDVLLHTHIGDLADEKNIAVLLPDMENSFCLDSGPYMRYESYFLEELLPLAQELLPLSPLREDRFIGGISMGGYGACRFSLLRPELFSRVVCLSPAIDIAYAFRYSRVCQIALPPAFGKHTDFAGHPDWDVLNLLESASPEKAPRYWIASGTRDMISERAAIFAAKAEEKGISAEYHSMEGAHDWAFWRNTIGPAFDFLLD